MRIAGITPEFVASIEQRLVLLGTEYGTACDEVKAAERRKQDIGNIMHTHQNLLQSARALLENNPEREIPF